MKKPFLIEAVNEDEIGQLIGPVAGLKVQKRAVEGPVAAAEVVDDHTARRVAVPYSGGKTREKQHWFGR